MSLINDALRRAKQVQKNAPEISSGPALRPVEPATFVRHGVGIAVPISITLLALVGLLVLWQMYQRQEKDKLSSSSQPVAQPAVTTSEPTRASASQPASTAGIRSPIVAASPTAPAETKAPPAQAPIIQTPPENNTPLAPALAATPQQADNTNTLTAAQPVLPKPAPLRLQGIVYDLKRPSAVINGKTLFLRDRIGEFRVAAIRQDSVTVVSVSRTNLLTLEP